MIKLVEEKMRFIKKDDHYLDTKTGLEWSLGYLGKFNYEKAINACDNLGNGWRLPTIDELISLVDYSLCSPCIGLQNMMSSYYWSSTTYVGSNVYAWRVDFYSGDIGFRGKSNHYCVRAIRSGRKTSEKNSMVNILNAILEIRMVK